MTTDARFTAQVATMVREIRDVYTAGSLARRIGVESRTVYRWEHGQGTPNRANYNALVAAHAEARAVAARRAAQAEPAY